MGDRAWHDRKYERGAAMVEFALVLPLLLMLLVGIASAGLAYNHKLSLTHAAREAGRFGATLPVTNFTNMNSWLDAVAQRAVDDAAGTLAPGTPGLIICVAYVHPDGTLATDSSTMRVDDGSPPVSYTTLAPNPLDLTEWCFADGRPTDERRVQVSVRREVDFNVVVFQTTLTLGSDAVNRFEAALGF